MNSYKTLLSGDFTEHGIDQGAKIDWRELDFAKVTELKQPLHHISHLNKLLNTVNEGLPQGGYLLCHTRTAALKRQLIMKSCPWGINYMVFTLHFLWHRVMPKLRLTKRLYFAVTKGKRRTFNRVEVLGRLYRAGFEVVNEEYRHGQLYVLARKVKDPIWNDTPSGGLLIKL